MAQGELLLLLVAHLLLTALPGVAAALFAARKGVRRVPVLLAIGLAASGLVALFAFWSYYADRLVGESYSYLVVFGSILLAAYSLYGGRIESALLRQLVTPLALWALGSVFLVFLGFLHGGSSSPLAMAATRFSSQLPSDNDLPRYFGEWFYLHGHHGTPPIYPGGWLASDRPPLQIGYMLSQWTFGWDDHSRNYQLIGVILQQLWIIGLWALLVAARVRRVTRGLVMITVLLSDLAIVNGFFVWPKMLPAAMLLAAGALVLTPLWTELRRNLWGTVLIAALFGIAMLGHGSSIFGIIPLALIAAIRGLPGWRWIGVGLLVGFVLMAPWSAYQKYGDPPGNRLTKWSLAGVPEIDPRSTTEAILDSYGKSGVAGTLHNKAENFVTMVGGGPMVNGINTAVNAAESGDFTVVLRESRTIFFFYLLPSMGLLLVAPLVMMAARRRGRLNPAEWSLALTCFAVVGLGAIVWGLLMFGNSSARAVIHVGSFVLPLLGICGAVLGLRATFPRFAIYFIGFSALVTLGIYVPSLTPPPGTNYSLLAALFSAVGLGGFAALAFRGEGCACDTSGRTVSTAD